ncbi:Fc.00g069490.m01.CDS01 [Cosmosporella sp. VM-42]
MAALAVPIRQYTEDASSASVTPTFLPSHDPLPGPSAPRNPLSYPSLGSSPKLPQYPHPSRDAVHPNRLPLAGQFAPMARPSSRPPPNRAAYRHHPYGVRPSTSGPAPGYSGEQMQHHNQQVAPYPTRGRGALEPQVHVGPPESYDMTRRLQERFRFGPPGPYPAITRNGDFPPNFRGLGRPASLYPAAACRRPNEDFDECPIVDELRHDLCDQVHATQQQFPDWSSEECLFHEVSRAWFHGKIGILKRTSEEWAFKLLVAIAENAVISLSIPRPNRVHRWLGDKEKELVARDVMAPLTHAVARFLPRVHLNS